jgi:hypothetical protein
MPSQRIRSYAIVTSRPAIHKMAEENYTRGKRNVFGHISGFGTGDDDVLPAFLRRCLFAGGLVKTAPHPRRRGGQSVPNESRESPT